MKISIQTIPHNEQRYDTCGDYWEEENPCLTQFRISEMTDTRYEYLILLHELVEYFLLKLQGVPLSLVDEFDISFEKSRPEGNLDEPGDDPTAPYFMQHQLATAIERLCALFFGVLWKEYEQACYELSWEPQVPNSII
jgi:hypothetical protein